jgi:hypothetical protein
MGPSAGRPDTTGPVSDLTLESVSCEPMSECLCTEQLAARQPRQEIEARDSMSIGRSVSLQSTPAQCPRIDGVTSLCPANINRIYS